MSPFQPIKGDIKGLCDSMEQVLVFGGNVTTVWYSRRSVDVEVQASSNMEF
jgi:hypothetical protein